MEKIKSDVFYRRGRPHNMGFKDDKLNDLIEEGRPLTLIATSITEVPHPKGEDYPGRYFINFKSGLDKEFQVPVEELDVDTTRRDGLSYYDSVLLRASNYIGQYFTLIPKKVLRGNKDGVVFILSSIKEARQDDIIKNYFGTTLEEQKNRIQEGQVRKATIRNIRRKSIQVELNGVFTNISAGELTYNYIDNIGVEMPELKLGDEIDVYVKKIRPNETGIDLTLSVKELSRVKQEKNIAIYKELIGEIIDAEVTTFGAANGVVFLGRPDGITIKAAVTDDTRMVQLNKGSKVAVEIISVDEEELTVAGMLV